MCVQNAKMILKLVKKKKIYALVRVSINLKIERTHEKVSCIARFYTSTHIS